MSESSIHLPELNLHGSRVWLSGAIPEPAGETPDTQAILEAWQGSELESGILGFVQEFASLVMKFGGEIVHGSHPSFTPILLECARRHRRTEHEKPLTLFVSDFWPEEHAGDRDRWQQVASVTVIPKVGGDSARDASLALLRESMSHYCNSFVAIGGRWWSAVPGRAGVPKEFELAKQQKVPSFVLGGFGGVSQSYVQENPRWPDGLENGLSDQQNQQLANDTNFVLTAGKIVSQLHLLHAGNDNSHSGASGEA